MTIEKKRKFTNHKYNTRFKNKRNKKYFNKNNSSIDNSDSDLDSDSNYDSDEEWTPENDKNYSKEYSDESDSDIETSDVYTECESDEEIISKSKKGKINNEKFTEMLSELFPSKYMSTKVKNNKLKKNDKKNDNLILEIIDINNSDLSEKESNDSNEDEKFDNLSNMDSDSENEKEKNTMNKKKETLTKFKTLANELLEKNSKNKFAKKILKNSEIQEKKIQELNEIKNREKNLYDLKNVIKIQNNLDFYKYFKKILPNEEQKNLINKIKSINENSHIEKPLLCKLLDLDIPEKYKQIGLKKFNHISKLEQDENEIFKIYNWFDIFISYVEKLNKLPIYKKYEEVILKKVNTLSSMDNGNGEYYKLKNWVDTFMSIPFNKNSNLPITISDGIEKCHDFMSTCKHTLDDVVFGMNEAKLQIMQLIGQWIVNPSAIGTAIAIKGPMGTGKTTLIKEGVSKILNRSFNLLALGGATDSSYLEGHGYTWEGSTWGKIVDILIQCKSSNPIIFFDELDKLSETPKGEEITGILTHLTDTTQNTNFHDKFFSEIDFDLSKSLFIFSYNDESKVNPILLDRMYKISIKGYNTKEKQIIAKKHLLPKIYNDLYFKNEEIIIDDDCIKYIIDSYTENEDGVRNLKRCLEIIFTKLNLFRLMKPGENLFEDILSLKVEFPIKLNENIINILLKKVKSGDEKWKLMYL